MGQQEVEISIPLAYYLLSLFLTRTPKKHLRPEE